MEPKKISFSFSKNVKKPEIKRAPLNTEKPVELIDCLEGQSIKIRNAVVVKEKKPLVIPVINSSRSFIERAKLAAKEKREKPVETKLDSELTLDELAAKELLQEANERNFQKLEKKVETLNVNTDNFVADGEPEPSIEDYENVPISDYGMAMLRGMGWSEGMAIGKSQAATARVSLPELRPKGLGLGANKLIIHKTQTPEEEKLQLVKGAYAKIIAGAHKGHYCEVQALDDQNYRIIVKLATTKEVLSLNEFLLVAVTKKDYSLGSKVINNAKYEAYKERDRSRSRSRSSERHHKKNKHKSHKSDSRRHKKKKSKSHKYSDSESDREHKRSSKHKR